MKESAGISARTVPASSAKVALAQSGCLLRMASSTHVASEEGLSYDEEGLSYDKVSSHQAVTNEDRGNNLFRIP
jgi:hypothetical protein